MARLARKRCQEDGEVRKGRKGRKGSKGRKEAWDEKEKRDNFGSM